MIEVNKLKLWTFEFGTGEVIGAPIHIIQGFQRRDRLDSQLPNQDKF